MGAPFCSNEMQCKQYFRFNEQRGILSYYGRRTFNFNRCILSKESTKDVLIYSTRRNLNSISEFLDTAKYPKSSLMFSSWSLRCGFHAEEMLSSSNSAKTCVLEVWFVSDKSYAQLRIVLPSRYCHSLTRPEHTPIAIFSHNSSLCSFSRSFDTGFYRCKNNHSQVAT